MLKYFKWFKRNAGKTRKSYNSNTGKGHTRVTQTTQKSPSLKISRSNNRNGTIRETTTWKRPDGFWTRKTRTVGSKPSPVRKPKFIKAKPFKAPKLRKIRKPKAIRTASYNRPRRQRQSSSVDWDGFFDAMALTPEESAFYEERTKQRKLSVMWFLLGMPDRNEEGEFQMGWRRKILAALLFIPVSMLVFVYESVTAVVGFVLHVVWELFLLGLKITFFLGIAFLIIRFVGNW